MSLPLRYKICRWPQAAKCLSNNSRKLKINVTEVLDGKTLEGLLLTVTHHDYGVLFATMISGSGEIISNKDPRGIALPWMTTKEILTQLGKFGFDITYAERLSLDNETVDLLMKLRKLNYDKITKIVVNESRDGKFIHHTYPVAIQSRYNQDLLTFSVLITQRKFHERASAGYLLNLLNFDNGTLKWDWIDAVYNIDDVLADNSDIEYFEIYQGGNRIYPITHADISTPAIDNSGLTPYEENESDDTSGG